MPRRLVKLLVVVAALTALPVPAAAAPARPPHPRAFVVLNSYIPVIRSSYQPDTYYTALAQGTAECGGGAVAGVNFHGAIPQLSGSVEMGFAGPVMVPCDGVPHGWSGTLRPTPYPGSGGMATVNLMQGPVVIASTGSQQIQIGS